MKITEKLISWIKIINPPPQIGGLEISDSFIRYIFAGKQVSLRLPAGVMQGGQVKNKEKLTAALKSLLRKPVNVVLSISAANVYTQIFNLPAISRGRLEEAARLNLQMISPIDIRSAYYDWQIVKQEDGKEGVINMVGAFVIAKVVDDLTECLHNAGFALAAVESAPFSLARAVDKVLGEKIKAPALVFNLSGDGLDFFVLKEGDLYFNYFVSWKEADNSLSGIKKLLDIELKRIMNFYTSRWGGLIEDLVLVSPTSNNELVSFIKDNFKINVHLLSLPVKGLSLNWAVAWGAALRGLIPRAEDSLISLESVGTEENFRRSRVLGFTVFWRNVATVLLAGLVVVYGIFDLLLIRSAAGLEKELASVPPGIDIGEASRLEKEAREFNLLADKALAVKEKSFKWSPLFFVFRGLAGQITLTQIQLQTESLNISIRGEAGSEREVIDFKNRLAAEKNFENVNLPLTSIRVDPSGKANFNVTFKLKKWPIN